MKSKEFHDLQLSLANDKVITPVKFGRCIQSDTIYLKSREYPMSSKKIEALTRIAEMQRYYQCNPVRFIKDFFNIELLDAQAYIVQMAWTCPNVLLVCSRGFGKALDLNTRIPTPDGDKIINDIHVGDMIFGNDGFPTKVICESPIYYNHDCFQLVFSDGEIINADADHIWSIYKGIDNQLNNVTTLDIYNAYTNNSLEQYSVPNNKPIQYSTKIQPINPYTFGQMLFDNKHISKNMCFIPDLYMYGDLKQRQLLLNGIIKAIGHNQDSSIVLKQSNQQMSIQISLLLSSLGIYNTRTTYQTEFVNSFQYNILNNQSNNPTKYIVDIHKIESIPVKCLMVDNTDHLFVCGEHNTITHNSTLIDLIIMAKDMLFNNYWCYIASGSGSQAEETFTVLEKLANDNIDTFMGSTGVVFKNEIEVKNAGGDGFSHSSNGFTYSTYNGSSTQTLNSNIDKKRGKRGSVVFDECGFLSEEMMNVYGAFAIVNKSFKSGTDGDGNSIDSVRLRTIPQDIPNQLFYISSASATDTKFYSLFREFSKKMFMGDQRYFVAMVTCEIPLHPTIHGKLMSPLYERSIIDSELKTNPEKARREYYCEFTTDAGPNAIVSRATINRNEEVRKPLLYNDTGDKKFIIAYDPARSRDNSVILVGEVYQDKLDDGTLDTKVRLVNCINLIDISKKKKSPMQTPDQIRYLKQVILDYNGGADNYDNIIRVYIDAGSGGGGVNIADYLMEDWVGEDGKEYRGLIDKTYSEEYVNRFPNAVDKISLMSPTMYKSDMFNAMIELMSQDKIKFTASYDNKDYLLIFDSDNNQKPNTKVQQVKAELKQSKNSSNHNDDLKGTMYKLDWQEKLALANIDALKEELINMIRINRSSGKDSFELVAEKANKLNDDRAYTCSMIAYGLMTVRRATIFQHKPCCDTNLIDKLTIRQPQRMKFV